MKQFNVFLSNASTNKTIYWDRCDVPVSNRLWNFITSQFHEFDEKIPLASVQLFWILFSPNFP